MDRAGAEVQGSRHILGRYRKLTSHQLNTSLTLSKSIGSTSTIMFNAINRPDTTYVSPIVGRDFKDNMEKQALFEEKDTRQIARIALAKYEYGDDYVSGMEGESGDEVEDGDGELLRASNGWEGVHGAYRPTESDEAAEDEREAACWDSLGLDEDSCLDEDERAGDSTDDSDSDEDDDSDVIYIGGYKKPDFSKLDAIDYKLYKLNGRSSAGASKWTREDVDDDEVVVPGMDEDDSEWDEYDCDEWGYLCGNHLGLNRFAKGVRLDTVEERQRYEDELENYDGEDEEDNDEQEWPEASVENVEGLYSTHTITDSQSMHDIDGGKQGEDDNPSTANLPRRAAPLKQSGPNVKRGREEDVEGDMENGVENEQECAIKKRKLDMPLPIREKVLFEDEL